MISRHLQIYILAAIMGLAVILRVAALLNFESSIYAGFLIWDEQVYQKWAMEILRGNYSASFVADFAPLPAYIMAFLYKVFCNSPLVFRLFNVGLSSLTCLLIYGIGKLLANRSVGLLACLIASIYGPFIFFSFTLLKTTLAVFLFALALFLFLSNLKVGNRLKVIAVGIVLGLLVNVRPNMILVLLIVPFGLAWDRYKKKIRWREGTLLLACYLAGLLLSVGPVSVLKYKASGEMTITTTSGSNLYLANNLKNPYPYYRPVPFAVASPAEQGKQFIVEASRKVGRELSASEASSFFIREVVNSAIQYPSLFVYKIFLKFLALFNRFESADNYDIGFMSNYIGLFKLPFIPFWLVLPFGMMGFAATMMKSRMSLALAGFFLFYGITLIIFFTNIRIRAPLVVILIPMAAWGVVELKTLVAERHWRRATVVLTVAFVFLLLAFIPIPGDDDLTGHYNTHAINLSRQGKNQEAVAFWEKSSQMQKPYSAYADLSLASFSLRRGRIEKALDYLSRIKDDSFAAAKRYEMLGDIYHRQGKEIEAVAAYEKSLEINSAVMNVRRKLNGQKVRMRKSESLLKVHPAEANF